MRLVVIQEVAEYISCQLKKVFRHESEFPDSENSHCGRKCRWPTEQLTSVRLMPRLNGWWQQGREGGSAHLHFSPNPFRVLNGLKSRVVCYRSLRSGISSDRSFSLLQPLSYVRSCFLPFILVGYVSHVASIRSSYNPPCCSPSFCHSRCCEGKS